MTSWTKTKVLIIRYLTVKPRNSHPIIFEEYSKLSGYMARAVNHGRVKTQHIARYLQLTKEQAGCNDSACVVDIKYGMTFTQTQKVYERARNKIMEV